jgi:hypothetical protein
MKKYYSSVRSAVLHFAELFGDFRGVPKVRELVHSELRVDALLSVWNN